MWMKPAKDATIVMGRLNVVAGTPTFKSATFAALGKGFIARDMGFANTAGPSKLHSTFEQSFFYRCRFDAFQDTLYEHSNRQFYRECNIYGTIDFIFGNAAVVLQNCNILPNVPMLAHDELKNKGFPIGLLPENVLDYSLNQTSGEFSVNLGDSCKTTLPPDNYLATYSKKITGNLVEGRIAELDGIRVRAFFQWWSISGIRLSGENLVFEVGMVSAKYPSKNFNETPACEGHRSSS
ncbi:hypothetical protein HHK36_006139 [Tetracentron sinense]|uniref:Pectinesterase n=1 Tax=Tetracentron sinense TaxID=13715 RepID=A0A834ZRB5_TETSI|nr:hypothetical protein HHK36_006139 [Tetracentron sinense]